MAWFYGGGIEPFKFYSGVTEKDYQRVFGKGWTYEKFNSNINFSLFLSLLGAILVNLGVFAVFVLVLMACGC